VIEALNAVVEKRPRWGFWKCYDRLRLDGHGWNHKRVYRVYKAMKLNLPRRTKRRLPQRVQQPMMVEARPNAEWSMDFMSDTLYQGRRFRTLNILDQGVREALDIVIDTSIPGGRVVRTLDRLVEWRGCPEAIRVDNGPEYLSQVFADWCKHNNVTLNYIHISSPESRTRTPTSSASIGPIATRCWTPTCSSHCARYAGSPAAGSTSTTRKGPTTAWARYRLLCSGDG
jgi:putative transposase